MEGREIPTDITDKLVEIDLQTDEPLIEYLLGNSILAPPFSLLFAAWRRKVPIDIVAQSMYHTWPIDHW